MGDSAERGQAQDRAADADVTSRQAGDPPDGGDGGTGPVEQPASAASLPARLRAVWAQHVGTSERALLLSWAAFASTFGTARGVTHWLRRRDSGSGGSGGIVIGGKHLHYYNLGILLLTSVGVLPCTALSTAGPTRRPRSPTESGRRSSSTSWRCCWTGRTCTGPAKAEPASTRRSW